MSYLFDIDIYPSAVIYTVPVLCLHSLPCDEVSRMRPLTNLLLITYPSPSLVSLHHSPSLSLLPSLPLSSFSRSSESPHSYSTYCLPIPLPHNVLSYFLNSLSSFSSTISLSSFLPSHLFLLLLFALSPPPSPLPFLVFFSTFLIFFSLHPPPLPFPPLIPHLPSVLPPLPHHHTPVTQGHVHSERHKALHFS